MEIYAPDTNFFLQCQPADQINWKLVTSEKEVVLLVVREVRKELDRLKSGGNQRRSKRARAASAILRRLTSEGLMEIELRKAAPRVVLRVAPRPPIEALPSDYRIESADERIVAEAYATRDMVDGQITFLSHDTVPLEDAMGLGLRTQVVPEAWLLAPEPSEVERELNDVKRRMKALEGRSPEIGVEIQIDKIDKEGHIRLESSYFPLLSDKFIADAIRKVRTKHAIGQNGEAPFRLGRAISALEEIDEARWTRYTKDHSEWSEKVEFALHDASRYMNEDPHGMKLPLTITNKGSAGAENLIVRIEVLGDFHLVDVDALEEEDEPSQYFPAPPPRPRSRILESLTGFRSASYDAPYNFAPQLETMRFVPPHVPKDRHSLYWEYDNDRHATCVEGQCQDFRHGLRHDEIVLSLERNAMGDEPIQGALEVLISAGNLAETKRITFPLHIEAKCADTEALIRDLLKRELDIDV